MAGCASCLHKNVHPNVCSDCLGGTHFKPRIKTNADRIRAMTDEELAQHLFDVANYACPPGKEFTTVSCGKDPDCEQCWLDWLKREEGE